MEPLTINSKAPPMKRTILPLLLLLSLAVQGQKYLTRDAYIRFFSSTPIEDIEAVNVQVSSILSAAKSDIVFQVPIKAFVFEKALMQEHFNENYMESDNFPNATFKGKIVGLPDLQSLTEEGTPIQVQGMLTIHGVAQEVEESFSIRKEKDHILFEGVFSVSPADHGIKIPSAVSDKIAESIEVSIKARYKTT